jgi:hypothetical protein
VSTFNPNPPLGRYFFGESDDEVARLGPTDVRYCKLCCGFGGFYFGLMGYWHDCMHCQNLTYEERGHFKPDPLTGAPSPRHIARLAWLETFPANPTDRRGRDKRRWRVEPVALTRSSAGTIPTVTATATATACMDRGFTSTRGRLSRYLRSVGRALAGR